MIGLKQLLQGGFPYPYWVKFVAYLWFAIVSAPLIVTSFGFSPLVPSAAYPASTGAIALCCVISFALMMVLFGPMTARTETGRQIQEFGRVIVLTCLALYGGYSAALAGLPMTAAVLSGSRTEATLTVADVRGNGRRQCRRRAVLADMEPLFSSLCGISISMLQQLEPGMQIVVSGWGIGSIILVDEFRIASPESL